MSEDKNFVKCSLGRLNNIQVSISTLKKFLVLALEEQKLKCTIRSQFSPNPADIFTIQMPKLKLEKVARRDLKERGKNLKTFKEPKIFSASHQFVGQQNPCSVYKIGHMEHKCVITGDRKMYRNIKIFINVSPKIFLSFGFAKPSLSLVTVEFLRFHFFVYFLTGLSVFATPVLIVAHL